MTGSAAGDPTTTSGRPLRTVLVASKGGHLTQLQQLVDRFVPAPTERIWITFDGPQARHLATRAEVVTVPVVHPRDWRGALRSTRHARELIDREHVDLVVSTGAAIAVSYLTTAALRRVPAVYIESATRSNGPSMTGRILAKVPRVRLFTQHRRWEGGRWRFAGSVFDGFEAVTRQPAEPRRSMVVTLGTQEPYGFRRLVERLVRIVPDDWEVLWQTGGTPVDDLGIAGRETVPAAEMDEAMRTADVVVAHAGTGSAVSAMSMGRCPVLVPREASHGEHVDGHQEQTARYLSSLGLAIAATVDELDLGVLERAAARGVDRRDPPPFDLGIETTRRWKAWR